MITYKLLTTEIQPTELYARIKNRFDYTVLLESMEGPEKFATQSIICFNPVEIFRIENDKLYRGEEVVVDTPNDFHLFLQQVLEKYNPEDYHSKSNQFKGGLIGFTSYDYVRYIEDLPEINKDRDFPDAMYGLFLDGVIFDHIHKTIKYFHHDQFDSREHIVNQVIDDNYKSKSQASFNQIEHTIPQERFEEMVRSIKEGIVEGETFQTVISQRINFRCNGDKFHIYEKLRQINPSPYMYCFEFAEYSIIGSSPELLVSVINENITTYPIAGTRPLGDTAKEREEYKEDLLSDEKEKAEHNMLVDLARNDVGKVSEFGSVEVSEYMQIEEFSHVIHMVSKVEGKLKPKLNQFDAFTATFPAGTVSGAPKVRSMEIIEELEPFSRGPYAGAVGYFGIFNEMVQAITIRTAFGRKNDMSIQAGAGIVLESEPTKEYDETLHKLSALIEILQE